MTDEEAIKELQEIKAAIDNVFTFSADRKRDALDLAAEALEYRPKGEWVKPDDPVCYMCSVCGKSTNQEIPGRFFSYCPKCGAKMEGGET